MSDWRSIIVATSLAVLPDPEVRAIAEGIGEALGLPNAVTNPGAVAKAAITAATQVSRLSDKKLAAYDAASHLYPRRLPLEN